MRVRLYGCKLRLLTDVFSAWSVERTTRRKERRGEERRRVSHAHCVARISCRRSSFHSSSLTIVSAPVHSLVDQTGSRHAAKTAKRVRQNCPGRKATDLPAVSVFRLTFVTVIALNACIGIRECQAIRVTCSSPVLSSQVEDRR